ncbi:Innexin [Fasciola gigantica]|uniref:Innexin n=1 Tax=Fasciola gigantica TaxID=46835 RepID=A0A504YHY8_FASGI|nr:Innexin [Fasciola gigantica]
MNKQREQYRALFRRRKGRPETNHLSTDPHSKGVPQPDMKGSIELKPQYDVESRTVPEPRDDTIDYHRQATSDAEQSHSLIGLVCSRLRRALCSNRFDRHRGTFLSVAYMFLKLLYLANAIGQLFLMQYFLGFQGGDATYGFGITVLQNIMNGHDWEATLVFPRVAYCYAPVKHLGTRTNTATAQCVLPVNMLNEKIYIFLWWWIVFVATLTAFSLFRWSIRMLSRTGPVDFVTKYLTLGEHYDPCDCELLQEFVRHFLRQDGVFLLKMLSYNAGELITSDVLALVWSAYREKQMSLTKPGHSVLPHSPDTESKEPGAKQSNVNVQPSAPRMPDLPPRPPNHPAHSMNGNLIPMGDTVSNRLPVLRPKPNSMSGTMV